MSKLSESAKRRLLAMARTAIEAAVMGKELPKFEVTGEELLEKRGAFVTLHKGGRLRGCIGYPEPIKTLWEAVVDGAISAALRDYRFEPVTPEELESLEVEISALSPMEKVKDASKIEVGRDGLMIRQHTHTGLLLPQVATEYGWDRETFLSQTCVKAGLPQDAWKKGAEILRFTAEVFSEGEFPR